MTPADRKPQIGTEIKNGYGNVVVGMFMRLHGSDLHEESIGNHYVYLDRGKGEKAQR